MAILWGVPPPPKRCRSEIGLLVVPPGEKRLCCVLGPLVGLQTHWVNKRTIPCDGSEKCQVHDYPITWKGFVPVSCANYTWRGPLTGEHPGVLVVTEEIGEFAAAWLRGWIVEVSRRGHAKNSPLSAIKMERTVKPELVAECFDVKPYVLRACGQAGRVLKFPRASAG